MSKQRERERLRIKKKQQRSQQLAAGGIVLVLIAGISFLLFSRGSESNEVRPISRLTTADFHSLAFSPTEPETVFFGHHDGLMVSHNGGKDWQPTTLSNADAMALALPESDAQVIYAAGHEVFYKSTDAGKPWKSVSTNLPGLDIHVLPLIPRMQIESSSMSLASASLAHRIEERLGLCYLQLRPLLLSTWPLAMTHKPSMQQQDKKVYGRVQMAGRRGAG